MMGSDCENVERDVEFCRWEPAIYAVGTRFAADFSNLIRYLFAIHRCCQRKGISLMDGYTVHAHFSVDFGSMMLNFRVLFRVSYS